MFSLVSFAFLKLFFLFPLVYSNNNSNIFDLSIIDYSFYDVLDDVLIEWTERTEITKIEIKHCENCSLSSKYKIKCVKEKFIQTEIEMQKGTNSILIPFNLTCVNKKNTNSLDHLSIVKGINNISLSWTSSSNNIKYYLIYLIKSNNEYIHRIIDRTTFYQMFTNLIEKSLHQICVATIDQQWKTSKFTCQMALTDFSTSGPVTNVLGAPDSNRIWLTWDKPEYEHDNPQGYIVNIVGSIREYCRTFIIQMTNQIVTPNKIVCQNPQTESWTSLKSLEIVNLSPHSSYNVEIFPINSNKQYKETTLSIKTKEGECEAVNNLKISKSSSGWFYISFEEPLNPNGVIIKYKIRVIQTNINICTNISNVILDSFTNELYKYISTDSFAKCGSYLLEVSPVNGWSSNEGVGKTASTIFHHDIDHPSSISVDSKFISINSLNIRLSSIQDNPKCDILAFVIEIINENNSSNCFTRIIYNNDCSQLRNMIRDKMKCSNIEFIKWNKESSKIEEVISGIFEYGNKYSSTVWMVNNRLNRIYSLSDLQGEDKETLILEAAISKLKRKQKNFLHPPNNCFTDCLGSGKYTGIRSADRDGNKCTKWRDSNKYSYYSGRTRSNICSMENDNIPWCPVDNSYGYCDIPKCSETHSGTGCVSTGTVHTSNYSISINWHRPQYSHNIIGYITLLHNTDNLCQRYHIQFKDQSQSQLHIRVKNFYLSCSTGSVNQSIKFETQFDNLHQNKEYFVYIIPIVSETSVGEVKNISVKTHLSKPITPRNVDCRSRSVDYIELSWDKQIETDKHGQSDYYIVSMRKFEWRENKESRAEKEYIKLRNLEMCSHYCVSVRSGNTAGSSELSEEICCRTLAAKPEKIELEDLISEYSTNRMIKWKSKKEANCERIYRVEYLVKHLEGSLSASTNESSIELRNLKKNVIYVVRVRAENTMETKDDEKIGEYSQDKEFFTGLTKFNLTSYGDAINYENKVLNVSWGISEDMKGLMFEYIIILRNESKICNHLVHIKCQNCEDPWKITNLNESTKELHKSLLNCTPMKIYDFNIEKTYFWYIIDSDKPFSNFSIQLFGVNLYGIHQLNEGKKEISVRSNNIVAQIVITIVCIIFLSCLILFIYVKCKRRPLFLYNILAKGKSQSPKRNTQNIDQNRNSEINGDVSKIKLSPRVSHIDKPPKPKPKQKRGAIALSAFAVYYERVKMNGNAEIIKEYKKLNAEAKSLESSLGLTTEVGKDTANSKKNRFINILPFDQNRVQIKEPGSNNDYINASYIPSMDDESKIEYIAAQGPIDGSLADFWQMIWERKIDCIVMLTKIIEDEKFKCLQYWPDSVGEYLNFGNKNEYKVILNGENEMEGYVERELVVENEETNEIRNIIQLHMNTWMDHCAPNMDYFDKMLFRFQEIINSTANSPYLIHCSAGVGRTGTLICIDRIVKELVNGCQELNIYETVLKLRNYRNFMVQRQAQYIFIHDYINHFLTKYMKIEGEDTYFNEELDQRV